MIEFLLTEILREIIRQIVRRVPYRPKTMSLSRGLRFVPAEPAERKIKRVSDATAALREQLAANPTRARRSTAALS